VDGSAIKQLGGLKAAPTKDSFKVIGGSHQSPCNAMPLTRRIGYPMHLIRYPHAVA
jgi:hypothetical protein